MAKKMFKALGVVGLLALVAREVPGLVREIKIWRMGSAPQGPDWYQSSGGS
jgi:hypothetical protein